MTANFLQVMEGSRLRSGHFLRCSLLAKCRLRLAQQVTALAHTLQRTRNFEASLHLVFQLKFFFLCQLRSLPAYGHPRPQNKKYFTHKKSQKKKPTPPDATVVHDPFLTFRALMTNTKIMSPNLTLLQDAG